MTGDTLGVKDFNKISLSPTISQVNAFYTLIQDGHQTCQENDF